MSDAYAFLLSHLPSVLSYLISDHKDLEELRMSIGSEVVLVSASKRIRSPIICTQALLDDTVSQLTDYSFYSHEDTVKDGYLSLPHGIRVGICGRAICENGKICAIRNLSFLNIRIPRQVCGMARPLYEKMREHCFSKGLLLYSLPGVGKTTALKDLAATLSQNGLSIAVIDQRGELSAGLLNLHAAIYRYYPKKEAITMAIKTATPQLLILDEISAEECSALLSAASGGIPVIATAHGKDIVEIVKRPGFTELFEHGLFPLTARLDRSGDRISYHFSAYPFLKGV
ncbi:MAG: AAA family ATPase [Clostridia bacterium]|nr:AAA family ATPase [Clostridia bacterium]